MFVLIVVAGEFLVDLLGDVSKFSTVGIRKVELCHIATYLLELFGHGYIFGLHAQGLCLGLKGKLIGYTSASLLEGEHVVLRTRIAAAVSIDHAHHSQEDAD